MFGGELGYKINFTSLTRNRPISTRSPRPRSPTAPASTTADPAIVKIPANCLLRGIPGTYSRFSAEAHWRRSFTDSFGQVFTPFASVRADAASMQIKNDPGVSNFITTGDTKLVRAMPTVGLEYRYPFISVQSWGTQTIEPIAQVIVRPNETADRQDGRTRMRKALIFDDSNLFRVDKFSGWDRVEGGGRANYGLQYTAQFNQRRLRQRVVRPVLQPVRHEFVRERRHHQYRPRQRPRHHRVRLRGARCPTSPTAPTRSPRASASTTTPSPCSGLELEGSRQLRPLECQRALWRLCRPARSSASSTAAKASSAPARSSSTPTGCCSAPRATTSMPASSTRTRIGLGYIDDCLILALNYITNYTYGSGVPALNHTIMLQLSLRTLGGTAVSQGVGAVGGPVRQTAPTGRCILTVSGTGHCDVEVEDD